MKQLVKISAGVVGLISLVALSIFGPIEFGRRMVKSARLALVPIDKDTTFVRFDHRRIDRIVLVSEKQENEEIKYLGLFLPVRYTENKQLIQKFCNMLKMKVPRADIATITSRVYVYHRDTLVYSGAFIVDSRNQRLDFQDSNYGATKVKLNLEILELLNEFSIYFWPIHWVPRNT